MAALHQAAAGCLLDDIRVEQAEVSTLASVHTLASVYLGKLRGTVQPAAIEQQQGICLQPVT
jgi:hypothetical protein